MAILAWSRQLRLEWRSIAPGKTTQNAFISLFPEFRSRSSTATGAAIILARPAVAARMKPTRPSGDGRGRYYDLSPSDLFPRVGWNGSAGFRLGDCSAFLRSHPLHRLWI